MIACVILAYDWNSAFAFNEKHSSLCTVVLFTVILTVSNLLQHTIPAKSTKNSSSGWRSIFKCLKKLFEALFLF